MCLRHLICDNRERNDWDLGWEVGRAFMSHLLKGERIIEGSKKSHVELTYSEIILLKQS